MKINYAFQMLLSGVSLFILISVYTYLNQIKGCDCFIENQHSKYKVNIEFLKFYQILEIITLFIFIVMITIYKNDIYKGGNKLGIKFFISLSMIVLLFITGYMSYNSLIFYLTSKKDCKCVNKYQKYIIYLQGIFNSIYFLRLVYLLFFVLLIIFFNS